MNCDEGDSDISEYQHKWWYELWLGLTWYHLVPQRQICWARRSQRPELNQLFLHHLHLHPSLHHHLLLLLPSPDLREEPRGLDWLPVVRMERAVCSSSSRSLKEKKVKLSLDSSGITSIFPYQRYDLDCIDWVPFCVMSPSESSRSSSAILSTTSSGSTRQSGLGGEGTF